jgi:hypothetical protein
VAIGSSKVFAGDDDIIGFSATVNPLDWSSEEDAGYLPFGLQTFGAMPVTALGLYRGNLAAFNSQGYQIWQIGEDPDDHALLDAGPIGCVWPRTPLAVMNDLVFLSAVGIRNIGVAGASTNLQVGNFGQSIDSLVIAKIAAGEYEPFSLYVPAYGQYWCFFGDEAFVLTINGNKQLSWSRYIFPEVITDWTLDGDDLMLRTITHKVWRLDVDALADDIAPAAETTSVMFGYLNAAITDAGVRYVNVASENTADRSIPVGAAFTYPTGIIAIGDTWIAATAGTTAQIWRSTDAGATWTEVYDHGSAVELWGLSYDGEDTLVCLSRAEGIPIVSTDGGLTWAPQTAIPSFAPDYAVFGAGIFAAADTAACFTSEDGVTWTERTVPFGGEIQFGGGHFIIFNSEDTNYRVAYSTDGITWDQVDTGIEVVQTIEAEQIAYNTDAGHWIVVENDRVLTTKGSADPADPSSTWTTFAWPSGTEYQGNSSSVAFSPGFGTVYALQLTGGNDAVYLNTDDTVDGWQLIQDLGALSSTGLFISSFGYVGEPGEGTPFEGVIHWPHLDLGSFGVEKQMVGFDLVATAPEGVRVSIGYDQRNLAYRTTDYEMDADTLPGKLVPIVVTAPSFDMKLTFESGQRWEWNASCLYINDRRPGS